MQVVQAELCCPESVLSIHFAAQFYCGRRHTHTHTQFFFKPEWFSAFSTHPRNLHVPLAPPSQPWGQKVGMVPPEQPVTTHLVGRRTELQFSVAGNGGRHLLGSATHEGTELFMTRWRDGSCMTPPGPRSSIASHGPTNRPQQEAAPWPLRTHGPSAEPFSSHG